MLYVLSLTSFVLLLLPWPSDCQAMTSAVDADCGREGMDCLDSLSGTVSARIASAVRKQAEKGGEIIAPNPEADIGRRKEPPDVAGHIAETYNAGSSEEETLSGLAGDVISQTQAQASSANSIQYGMTLDQCVQQLEQSRYNLKVKQSELTQLRNVVTTSQDRVKSTQKLSKRIWDKESSFASELQNLFVLYNDVAVRSNTLETWMADEKHVRDQLTSVYRMLDKKSVQQSEELFGLTTTLRGALSRMQEIHDHVSKVLTAVANAETAMYSWAYNVTMKVNSQTTKIINLAQGLEYRIAQVDNANREMSKMSQLFLKMATKHKDADFIDAANDMISQFQVEANSQTFADLPVGNDHTYARPKLE